jgi:hypothetical protein
MREKISKKKRWRRSENKRSNELILDEKLSKLRNDREMREDECFSSLVLYDQ